MQINCLNLNGSKIGISVSKKIITLLVVSLLAFVNVHAEIDSTWLVDQQNLNGSFSAVNDLGYPAQNTSEALLTLYALDDINLVNESLGLQIINDSDSIHLENIIRKILVNKKASQNTDLLITQLKSFINFDGGFGSRVDYQSTILDTALATQAWATSNALLGDEFGYAVGYLTSRQNGDGSWSSAGNESSIYATAMASLALQKAQSIFDVTDKINTANSYLINNIQNNIAGIETFEIALAVLSIAPTTSDKTTYQFLLDRLQLTRDIDGSWSQDTYSTALAMRALSLSEQDVPVDNDLSSVVQPGSSISAVTGVITDSLTGQVLAGVSINIGTEDGNNTSATTGADGSYVISNLFPGEATVTVDLSGYRTATASPTLIAGIIQRFNPVLAQQPLPVPVNIIGSVIDADTGLTLSGVSIQIINSSVEGLSDTTGSFALNGLSPGSISIQISNAGYISRSYVISAASGGLVNLGLVALTPGSASNNPAALSGTITDAISNQPLNGVAISLSGADNQSAFTDVNGVFTISNVNPGGSNITAIFAGYTNAVSSISITAGINTQLNVALVQADNPAQITLQGRVVDNETQLPLFGVAVEVIEEVTGQLQLVQTNAEGEFQLGGLVSGLLKVSLSHVDYQNLKYSITAIKGGLVNLGLIKLSENFSPTGPEEIISVNVPGTSDMWLAGMPDGTISTGDTAPAHSPVLVRDLDLSGELLTFSNVTGGVSHEPGCTSSTGIGCDAPDGNSGRFFNYFPGAINGMSDARAPLNALMGVFLDDSQPDGSLAPNTLNFEANGTDFTSLSPELKQVFFIGDGLTGNGNGEVQRFSIPAGATRLYLGTMDGNGWFNNSGVLNVDIIVNESGDEIDLTIASLSVDKVSTNLQTLQIHGVAEVSIKNTGLASVEIPALVTVFEDSNANALYDLNVDNALGTITVFAVQEHNESLDIDIPLSGVVTFRDSPIYVMVDSDLQIAETDEVNNINNTIKLCRTADTVPGQAVENLADVSASLLKINRDTDQSISISVRIGNGGVLSIEQPFNIGFYEGNPITNGILLGTVTLDNLASAIFEDVTLNNIPALSGNDDLYVVADIHNVIQECNELNNSVSLPVFAGSSVSATLSVGTSESQYVAGSAIALQGNVINSSVLPGQFQAQLQIEDTEGNLIQAFALHNTDTLAGQDTLNISDVWDSAGFLTGSYQLRGQLFDLQGELLSTATHVFSLTSKQGSTPGKVVAAIRVNTDKLNYHTSDQVFIDNLISNLSNDTVINNASLRVTITNAASTSVFTQTVSLSSLTAGSRLQQRIDYRFSNEAEGDYTVTAQLLTQQGAILANAETSYTVVSDKTKNIAGETGVQESSVLAGQSQICTDKIQNTGNRNLTALSIQQVVIDVNTQQIMQTQTQAINLNIAEEQTLVRNINTASLVQGDYICALQASIDGNLHTLDFAAFTVLEAPVNVDGGITLGSRGQLLVWLGERNHQHPHNDNHHDASQDNGHHYDHHYGHHDHQHQHNDNQNEQRQYLETLLNDGGWNYTLVDNRDVFITEFSRGQYQAYLLLTGKEHLGNYLEKALREAVNRGEGLVMFSRQHNHAYRAHQNGWSSQLSQQKALPEVFGVRLHNHLVRSQSFYFTENNILDLQGSIDFDEVKQGRSIELIQAQEIMRYTQVDDGAGGHNHNDGDSHSYNWGSWGNWGNGGHHNNGSNHGSHHTAVSFNQYGKGRALYAGFDVLAYATQYQDKTLLTDLINRALDKTHPTELALLTSSVVPIDITITNLGSDASVQATLTAPVNATWLRAAEGNIVDTAVIWQYPLPADNERDFTAWLQLPDVVGEVAITLLIEAGIDANNLITQDNLSLNLSVPPTVTLDEIIDHIQGLRSQGYRHRYLKSALRKLKKARELEQRGRLSDAATRVLSATDLLKNKTNPVIIDVRLQIDDWLRMATLRDGGHWCRYITSGN